MTTLCSFNKHRFVNNPKEKEIHDKFKRQILKNKYSLLDKLVFGSRDEAQQIPNAYLSNREKQIALTVVQWLGSPIGEMFLDTCGYELKGKKTAKPSDRLREYEEFQDTVLRDIQYLYRKFEEGDCDPSPSETKMLNQCLSEIERIKDKIKGIYDTH